jgi:Ca2+-binding EF-hand superfamily protein
VIKKEEMKEQADKWFKNRDKNDDGKLSFEEFEAGRNQKKKTD